MDIKHKATLDTLVNHQILIWGVNILVALALMVRLFRFIDRYSVNILHNDMWDFYTPIFNHESLLHLFRYQLGAHREGLGLVITKFVATLSGWNSRGDAFAIGVMLVIAMLIAYVIKIILFKRIQLTDVVIPLAFLNLMQYDQFSGTPQIAYAGAPPVLIMLYCAAWLIKPPDVKYWIILAINLLCWFTGFALFIGGITLIILGWKTIDAYRRSDPGRNKLSIYLAIAIISPVLFLIDYVPTTGGACFTINGNYIVRYPAYMAIMFSKFAGINYSQTKALSFIAGTIILSCMGYVFIRLLITFFKKDQVGPEVLLPSILIGFSLMFALFTAVGRMCLGFIFAESSRYTTLLIPAFFGFYLGLLAVKFRFKDIGILLLVALQVLPVLFFPIIDQNTARAFYEAKTAWKSCYLQIEDIEKCNESTNFNLHGWTDDALRAKFMYLKENRLNLFLDD
jgi:hypothetical protein